MLRLPSRAALLAALLLAATLKPATAAENPLEALPQSAVLAIRIQKPDTLTDKIGKLVTKIDSELGKEYSQQAPLAKGMIISNPSLAGVDRRRDWWIAVFLREQGDPATVFAVPVADRDQMKEALGGGEQGGGGRFQFTDYDNWLLYSEDAGAISEIRARVAGRGDSLKATVKEKSLEMMDDSDVSLFVNVKSITGHYKIELDAAVEEIEATLDQLPEMSPQVEGLDLEPVFQMYGEMFRNLVQGIRDSEAVTVGISVQSRGVVIEELLSVKGGSATAELFHRNPPRKLDLIRQLPPDQLMYMALGADMQGMMGWASQLTTAMVQDETKRTQLQQYFDELSLMKFGATASTFSLSTKAGGGAIRTSQLAEIEEPQKMRDLTRKMPEALAGIGSVAGGGQGVEQEIKLETDVEEYDSHKADLMTVRQTIDPQADPLGIARGMSEMLLGPEGSQTRLVYLDKLMVQTTGGGKPAMTEALKFAEGKATLDRQSAPEIDSTIRRALDESNLIVLFDVPKLVTDLFKLVSQSGQLPLAVDPADIRKISSGKSWMGFSLATEQAGLRAKTWVPVEQIEGLYEIGKLVQKLTGGMMGPGGGPGGPGAAPPQL
ncbi:MAG: hypothetical protein KDA79_07145 [Planctomycetaceae bacterium]|nr:hypothetical protein [Planctomycetaceae bacterium]